MAGLADNLSPDIGEDRRGYDFTTINVLCPELEMGALSVWILFCIHKTE
jgi:hypothetical protein